MVSPVGVVEIVGTTRKLLSRCLSFSHGCSLNTSFNIIAAKPSTLTTICRLSEMHGRDTCVTAFFTKLDLPNRLGLISIRWLSLFSNCFIRCSSSSLSVKYSPSTMVPNLNGFFICDNFRYELFRKYKHKPSKHQTTYTYLAVLSIILTSRKHYYITHSHPVLRS